MTMRVCDTCGTPVGDSWEHCLRCGEELAPLAAPPTGLRERVLSRLGLKTGSAARLSMPAGRGRAALTALNVSIPGWALAPFILAIVALLWILAAGSDDGTALAAHDAARDAAAEATLLAATLEETEADRDRLAAEVVAAEERAAEVEASLASDSADLEELRSELAATQETASEAQTALEATRQTLQDRETRIVALEECLDGTTVALAFARDGRSGAAEMALAAVADACAAARG